MVGVATGPPKTSIVPNPTSSHAMKRTLGDPSGASGARKGDQSGVDSRMSTAILPFHFFAMGTPLGRDTALRVKSPEPLRPGGRAQVPYHPSGRAARRVPVMADRHPGRATAIWQVLVGPPRTARGSGKERITPVEGLSALSLDALTSVAYGPEAIILVLAVAGAGALHLVLPITIAIVVLLAILVFSYRQVIDAYPMGGGAYAVSRANFGAQHQPRRGRLTGRRLHAHRRRLDRGRRRRAPRPPSRRSTAATVPLCLGILALHHGAQPAGPRRDGARLPAADHDLHRRAPGHHRHRPHPSPRAQRSRSRARRCCRRHGLKAVSVLLVLKAFSAGCSALTGVEAIANGVPLFREPRAVRAKRTEMLLGLILGAMLLGLAVLAKRWHIGPTVGPDRAQPDHGHGRRARAGPTTSCRSRSPSCSPWRPTPPSAGSRSWPASWRGTTTCPTSSPSGATARSSPTASWCSPSWRARCSSPSAATRTR